MTFSGYVHFPIFVKPFNKLLVGFKNKGFARYAQTLWLLSAGRNLVSARELDVIDVDVLLLEDIFNGISVKREISETDYRDEIRFVDPYHV